MHHHLDILKKVWIIFNHKIFKLTLYKLGLIPSSLALNTKLNGAISSTKRMDYFFWENGFFIIKVATL
jgi:hypothetical protein